ncbi:MAG: DUF6445 family protein [Sphingomicrobium sp.]
MKPELRRVGQSATPILVIDEFRGGVDDVIDMAAELAPFPDQPGNFYPGLRRVIEEVEGRAWNYVRQTLTDAAQFIGGAFNVRGFDLLEASFSMVTTAASELGPAQRSAHFDTTDPKIFALLHYLNVPAGSGTAFYRQRTTDVEVVTELNVDTFVQVNRQEEAALPAGSGYLLGSDHRFEQIGAVEALPDRMIIYPGCLLHSGIIPDGMNRSSNPREGRLTANFFIRGY